MYLKYSLTEKYSKTTGMNWIIQIFRKNKKFRVNASSMEQLGACVFINTLRLILELILRIDVKDISNMCLQTVKLPS